MENYISLLQHPQVHELYTRRDSDPLLTPGAEKLLDIAMMYLGRKYASNNAANYKVLIPLDEYTELCGLAYSTKSNRQKVLSSVQKDLNLLKDTHLSVLDASDSPIHIFDTANVSYAGIEVVFAEEFARKLIGGRYFIQLPASLLKTDNRNSLVYPLGRELASQASLDCNEAKGMDHVISMDCLIDRCPALPRLDRTLNSSYLQRKCVDPLKKALDRLQQAGILKEWRIERADSKQSWSMRSIKSAKLFFIFNNFPDVLDRSPKKKTVRQDGNYSRESITAGDSQHSTKKNGKTESKKSTKVRSFEERLRKGWCTFESKK